ncbi:hypothetical protein LCGC14_0567010 [marine sediment metagenome]|uniref:Uncharacterized protein n=1 Tax=marine sediment metagenome TaxID=412755 RepID=A0A0F9RQK6_9ZZZZ
MELKKEDFKKFRIVDTHFYALPPSFFEEEKSIVAKVIGKAIERVVVISETKTGNKRAIIGHDPSDIPTINKTIDDAILKEAKEEEVSITAMESLGEAIEEMAEAIVEEVKPTEEELAEIEKLRLIAEKQAELAKLLGD